MGGLMSFKSSYTAASAALETMNAGREVDRGSNRPLPRTPTAATSISSMESLWLRRGSSTYAEPRCGATPGGSAGGVGSAWTWSGSPAVVRQARLQGLVVAADAPTGFAARPASAAGR